MSGTIAHRIMGGSPLAVLGRLLVVSLLVGALMSWLDIDPAALFDWLRVSAMRLWASGFESLHLLGRYIVTGAALVIPVWLLIRLTSIGSATPKPRAGRWELPGAPDTDALSKSVRSEPRG